jgi:hypothetical protein
MKYLPLEVVYAILTGCIIIILVIIALLYPAPKQMEQQNIYIQCCNGQACTDTYYTYKDNLCHLCLCESSPLNFFNKFNCTYPGRNVTVSLE